MRTMEQQRAANALARANELASRYGESKTFKERYRSYVDRLGPAVVMNGLGQALATERAGAGACPSADDEKAHHELYAAVGDWLCRQDGGIYPPGTDLLREIMSNDEQCYLKAQAEALAWLEWHKKCCRALFPDEKAREA